jgi:hypothetical protein
MRRVEPLTLLSADHQASGSAHRREAGEGRGAAEGRRGGEGQDRPRAQRHRQTEQNQVIKVSLVWV